MSGFFGIYFSILAHSNSQPIGQIVMPTAQEQIFTNKMNELRSYLKGIELLVVHANNTQRDYSHPVMCLIEQMQRMLTDPLWNNVSQDNASRDNEHHETICDIIMFCEAIHSLLTLSRRVNLSWLSTVPPLLSKLTEIINKHIDNPS